MKTPKLKRCPICGSKDIWLWFSPYRILKKWGYECFSCGFCAKWANTKRGAVREWNRMCEED